MKLIKRTPVGFTIVELLIVVVVIAILATITVVTYNGIQNQSKQSVVQSSAQQAAKKIMQHHIQNGVLPASPAAAGLVDAGGITYSLTSSGDWFCIIASKDGVASGMGSGGHCGGLNASYYNNTTMTGVPALTRIDRTLHMHWDVGSPGRGINDNNISAVWTGYIAGPVTGDYTLYVYPDNRVRVYLDGVSVINTWSSPCCVDYTASYAFTSGERVPIRVEWAEDGGNAYVLTSWSYPGQTRTPIPASAFSAY